jgi:hypothetical protein
LVANKGAIAGFELTLTLLLADEALRFVQFEARDLKAMNCAIVKLDRTEADASSKAHDRVAVHVSQALGCTDRAALSEGGNDGDLLVEGKDVHRPNP